jgi:hypothetical protein
MMPKAENNDRADRYASGKAVNPMKTALVRQRERRL